MVRAQPRPSVNERELASKVMEETQESKNGVWGGDEGSKKIVFPEKIESSHAQKFTIRILIYFSCFISVWNYRGSATIPYHHDNIKVYFSILNYACC
jgi:hypothetical protein